VGEIAITFFYYNYIFAFSVNIFVGSRTQLWKANKMSVLCSVWFLTFRELKYRRAGTDISKYCLLMTSPCHVCPNNITVCLLSYTRIFFKLFILVIIFSIYIDFCYIYYISIVTSNISKLYIKSYFNRC
jgi:predicted transporter